MLQACLGITLKGMFPKVTLASGRVPALFANDDKERIANAQWPLKDVVAAVAPKVAGSFKGHAPTASNFHTTTLKWRRCDYSEAVVNRGVG